jgi:hypothetical protein
MTFQTPFLSVLFITYDKHDISNSIHFFMVSEELSVRMFKHRINFSHSLSVSCYWFNLLSPSKVKIKYTLGLNIFLTAGSMSSNYRNLGKRYL